MMNTEPRYSAVPGYTHFFVCGKWYGATKDSPQTNLTPKGVSTEHAAREACWNDKRKQENIHATTANTTDTADAKESGDYQHEGEMCGSHTDNDSHE